MHQHAKTEHLELCVGQTQQFSQCLKIGRQAVRVGRIQGIGVEATSAFAQCRQGKCGTVIVAVYPFGQTQFMRQILIIEAVSADKGAMSPQIQQQLETPLQRQRTGVNGAATAVCERD